MRLDVVDALWIVLCLAALHLVLPKRSWRQIGPRLREVRIGRRRHVFGPPTLVSASSASQGTFALLRHRFAAEWRRLLELGVVGWILALAAEEQGRRRRQELLSQWRLAPAGLVFEHLSGGIDADRVEGAVAKQGCALAPKAMRQVRPTVVVPAIAWLRESRRPVPVDALDAAGEREAGETAGPQVQTLGLLRITTAVEDLTTDLLKRPTLAFLWQYLLVRALLNPRAGVTRDAIADELYAGVDPSQQRKRLSHRLYDFQKLLKPELVATVIVGELDLRFDLDSCDVDVARILGLAEQVREAEGLLGHSAFKAINDLLPTASAEFLPDWEDLEQTVTGGRGTSGDLVRQVRQRLEDSRITLLVALGEHHLSARNPGQAVLALEEAYELRPDRVDVVSKLIDALEAAGQGTRAKELRGRSQLTREQPA